MDSNRQTTIVLAFIFLVLVAAIAVISITIYTAVEQGGGDLFTDVKRSKVPSVLQRPATVTTTVVATPIPDNSYGFPITSEGAYTLIDEEINYNFSIFDEKIYEKSGRTGIIEPGLFFDIPKADVELDFTETNTSFASIDIPSLKLHSRILQSNDSATSTLNGWWLVPVTSYLDNESEKIIMCQRRYFELDDRRSCQYLNLIEKNDEILVYSQNGELRRFRVISIDAVPESTSTLLKASNINYIKLITSSDPEGFFLGENSRLVILAEQI